MAAVVAKLSRESDPSDTTAAPGCGRFTSTLPILPPWVNPDIAGEPWCRRLEWDFGPTPDWRVTRLGCPAMCPSADQIWRFLARDGWNAIAALPQRCEAPRRCGRPGHPRFATFYATNWDSRPAGSKAPKDLPKPAPYFVPAYDLVQQVSREDDQAQGLGLGPFKLVSKFCPLNLTFAVRRV
jgi:hypothetical protein